ncbi:unnamed protein product [Paramecium primaurelia]|uniref:GOLD domain-containing protein n=1 Tax=Paramecium primaurelia TaxID=5886 RepID=A0A8S1JQ12_PARPR|nr:unnamed protein product [Paramecium primaurelia]
MILLLLVINSAYCLQFGYEAEKGQQICFTDNFSKEDVFDIRISANSSNYGVKIAEANSQSIDSLYDRKGSWEHNYQYQSTSATAHVRYCLTNFENDFIMFNITYKTGSELANMGKVAKISDLNQMGGIIKKLNTQLDDIKRERSFLIEKFDYMSKLQGSISKKQMAFGFLCLGLSMIITVITVNMIKRILRLKKES